ncbi:MAG: phenylacetaldoxime dehydratase family protein [Capsulimonadales bacterium]|nr:phenylacetaldoxime dehydratase family protein [Capsulimonadales bacterium]
MNSGAYVARLWEFPRLCLAFFGVQYLTPEGKQLYETSGINDQVFSALTPDTEGLLLNRLMMTEDGPVLMQYWRSYEELDRFARSLPHTDWWKWLVANSGQGVGFYHEIYQAATAEAIYESGTRPVGPAVFCAVDSVPSGNGQSRRRQERFAEAKATEEG